MPGEQAPKSRRKTPSSERAYRVIMAARMNVVLGDIEENALDDAVRELEERQVNVLGVVTDTMRKQAVQALAEQAVAEFGNIHVLCNNAGVASTSSGGKAVWELPDSDWDWVVGVNFYGVLYGLQAFVPHMVGHGTPKLCARSATAALSIGRETAAS